ncbi:MAG: LytR C-terminal domain-containing protein [Ignavibacteria bacterium]
MTRSLINYILNGAIIILLLLVGYFGFSLINNAVKSDSEGKDPSDTTSSITNQPNLAIQLDVQNGTSENGVAAKFTDYLRRNGYDVVEMGNFKSRGEERTIVIDRSGDMSKAKRVAKLLGVSEKNIVQQINNSLYLDVTVVIGKDYKDLNPYKEIRK